MKEQLIDNAYSIARERYASIGVDTDKAMDILQNISLSMHCWQADDVTGFESAGALTGGIQTTGNYPGKARNMEEVRMDILKAMSVHTPAASTVSACTRYTVTSADGSSTATRLSRHTSTAGCSGLRRTA